MSVNSYSMNPVNLTCDYLENPLGINSKQPGLSWELVSDERNQTQTAYQIIAASSEKLIASEKSDLWDSGKIISNKTLQVKYTGKAFNSGDRIWWRVRVWDKNDGQSAFSKPAFFEAAILNPEDWKASWIKRSEPEIKDESELYNEHPSPLFRKTFALFRKPQKARLYISGLGYYESSINGKRIGENRLDPGWTNYNKRILYSVYDVTSELKNGKNTIGIIAGNGWFNPLPLRFWGGLNMREHLPTGTPQVFAQLEIEFEDGTKSRIFTDETWKTTGSPILKNNIYLGEVYDARLEINNWDSPELDDSKWESAKKAESPGGNLEAQSAPPILITKKITPVSKTKTAAGTWIFDMGQNFAGWAKIKAKGEAGTKIQMRFGELLKTDGTLNVMTSVCGQIKSEGIGGNGSPAVAEQSDIFILKGTGDFETYSPRFTFHGFRYVEIIGYPGEPSLESLEGLRMNSDVKKTSTFRCSEEMLNKIQEMTEWTFQSNLFSVQSDCPHREKLGYGGDIVATAEMAMLNYNMETFYNKTVNDYSDAARKNGGLTETAPYVGISDEGLGEMSGPVEWGTAYPLLQYLLYQYYGNKEVLENNYKRTTDWMKLLESKAEDYILVNGIGDHESLVTKSRDITGTSFFYLNTLIAGKIAGILEKKEDVEKYRTLAEKIKSAFGAKIINKETGVCGSLTQANQAIPLDFGLVPDELKQKAAEQLAADVAARNYHLSTGIFGTRSMLLALSENDKIETALKLSLTKDFPGWGYMIEKGATTLWEHWEFSDNTFSHNHPMFGSICEWNIKSIAGLAPLPDAEGFNKIRIKPEAAGYLKWAKCEYKSVRGKIKTSWKTENNIFSMDIEIPPNVSAEVYIPVKEKSEILENNTPAENNKDITKIKQEGRYIIYKIGSGKYSFSAK